MRKGEVEGGAYVEGCCGGEGGEEESEEAREGVHYLVEDEGSFDE